jgi:deoxycytidylate deaminase
MDKRDQKFFKVAEAVAATSTYNGVHIGAVIVKKNSIISVGVNAEKSHPIQKLHNSKRDLGVEEIHHNIHAEMAAIIKTKSKNLKGCEVFVYRQKKDGKLGMSRPCAACMDALIKYGVKVFHYTSDIGYVTEEVQ